MTVKTSKEKGAKQLIFAIVAIAASLLAIYMTTRSIDDSRWGGPTVEERIRDIQNSDIPEQAKTIALSRLQTPPPSGPRKAAP